MIVFLRFLISIGVIAFWVGIYEIWEDAKVFLNEIYPNLTYIVLGILLIIGAVAGIYDYKLRRSKNHGDGIQSNQIHISELKKVYDRLEWLKEETKDTKLILKVPPPNSLIKQNDKESLEDARKRILEYNKMSWSEVIFVTNLDYAINHLKTGYKDAYKHWKKILDLQKEYDNNKKESTLREIIESIKSFRNEVQTLCRKLENGHNLKGKCSICP